MATASEYMSGCGKHRVVNRNCRYLALPAMNYLAHLYLSGSDPLVMVGNFMGDAVRGRDLSALHEKVEKGVRLHRAIDHLTDNHPDAARARKLLHPSASKYAGVVLDLFYDHLLAINWKEFHPDPLPDFTAESYGTLMEHIDLMPARIQHMLPQMMRQDWLSNYAAVEGLARSLRGISTRTSDPTKLIGAEAILIADRDEFDASFRMVMKDVFDLTRSMT